MSADKELEALKARVTALEKTFQVMADAITRGMGAPTPAAGGAKKGAAPPAQAPVDPKLRPGQVAPEEDLEGQYGNPEVYKDPYGWQGGSWEKRRMSDCPSVYLEAVANDLDDFGVKLLAKGDYDKAAWKFRDAGRARGWAQRNRNAPAHDAETGEVEGAGARWQPPAQGAAGFEDDDDAIPF